MGLDPGLNHTGWGVVDSVGSSVSLIKHGVVETSSCKDIYEKLSTIFSTLVDVCCSYDIKEASIENVFVNTNPKSSMYLCYGRSASIISLMSKGIRIFEYSSTKIKKFIVGHGRATKDQVKFMVKATFDLDKDVEICEHSADALAAALCHVYSRNSFNKLLSTAL